MAKLKIFLLIFAILFSGCSPGLATEKPGLPSSAAETIPIPSSSPEERSLLTYDDLMDGVMVDSPVNESALTKPENASPPVHIFEGRLKLVWRQGDGQIENLRGELDPVYRSMPSFEMDFVQDNGYLIPTRRASIVLEHPGWNMIVEPGYVWQEDGDRGLSRASFPLALVVKGGNATFNGTLTFLFDGQQVSRVWYQFTQETTSYVRVNMWGFYEAEYQPMPIPAALEIRADFKDELNSRFPTKPIDALPLDHPGTDISAFGSGVTREHMTWYGFLIDGVNYVGGCQTRFGAYPYCEYMRTTSYSTAKSAFVSVALMRLAQMYAPEVANELIRDHLPEVANSPGDWSKVTFNDTIDMSTGNYRSKARMADEDSQQMNEFFGAQPYAVRMAIALDWSNSSPPGVNWVYRTSDTFILTRAMQNFLQSRLGEDADIFEFVVDQVYRPLKMSPGFMSTMRTQDNGWQGQAEGGYGIWWIPDDVAKLTTLLLNAGRIGENQVLEPSILAAALQQDPLDRGVTIDTGNRYNNAFWATLYLPSKSSGFDCEFWVTTMQGVSGNVVALFPDGTVYYYFSDNQEFTWDAALREANKLKSMCD